MNWSVQLLNGLAFGLLLFLIAAGLSVTFGVMRVMNLTHGAIYGVGAYLGYSITERGFGFVVACLGALVVCFLIGAVQQSVLLWPIRHDELAQVLLTVGLLLVVVDLSETIWGAIPLRVPPPGLFDDSIDIGGSAFPSYRLALIAIGAVLAVLLYLVLEKTPVGAIVRAGVDDGELVELHGIKLRRLFLMVFAAGTGLAGLAGVLGGPILGAYAGAGYDVLSLALVVVVVGGLGTIEGALVGAIFVGLVDSYGKALFPDLAAFTVYVPMILILAVRPQGLVAWRA